jgi:hypothetical protein
MCRVWVEDLGLFHGNVSVGQQLLLLILLSFKTTNTQIVNGTSSVTAGEHWEQSAGGLSEED